MKSSISEKKTKKTKKGFFYWLFSGGLIIGNGMPGSFFGMCAVALIFGLISSTIKISESTGTDLNEFIVLYVLGISISSILFFIGYKIYNKKYEKRSKHYEEKGVKFLLNNKDRKAKECLKRAIKINPFNVSAYDSLQKATSQKKKAF